MIGDEKQKTYQVKLTSDQTITKDNKSFVKRAPIPPENSSSKEMNPNDSSGDEDQDEDEEIEVEQMDLESSSSQCHGRRLMAFQTTSKGTH